MITDEMFQKMKPYRKYRAKNSEGKTVRISKTPEDEIFLYAKGRSRYGNYFTKEQGCSMFILMDTPEKEEQAWKRRIRRAIKIMEESGLWEDIKAHYKELLTVPFEDFQYINQNNWDYARKDPEINRRVEEILKKYPCLENSFFQGELGYCQTKSMYFGWNNKLYKEQIKERMKNRAKFTARTRTTYDVTFEYEPDKKMAWYSEEYKDCGNGHYYLAINESTAIFVEDD